MRNHPLIETILSVRGNPRACLYTEPLWAIPYFLYIPFVSIYMSALGLTDSQIGIVASTSLLFMAVSAVLGGAITDKLGRRFATLVFDILSWSIPCLLWAFSQNFIWFMAAAALNGLMQVTANSWTCLLVEDAQKNMLVRIYSIMHLISQMAVIFAPIAAVMIDRFTIIPVMRVLYLFSFTSMTAKFIILYTKCTETQVGAVRKRETAHMSIPKILMGYGAVFRRVLASKRMVLALTISAVLNVITMVNGNFFGLYTTLSLLMPDSQLAYYPILRSVIIVLFLFIVQPHMMKLGFKRPMLTGIVIYVISQAVLLLAPVGNMVMPFVYIFIEACALSLVMPNRDSLVALLIDPDERARISSIMTTLVLGFSMPFGYLAGYLSDINRRLPFVLNIGLFVLVFVVICAGSKQLKEIEHKNGH